MANIRMQEVLVYWDGSIVTPFACVRDAAKFLKCTGKEVLRAIETGSIVKRNGRDFKVKFANEKQAEIPVYREQKKKRIGTPKPCAQCGKTFIPFTNKGVYCSLKCLGHANTKPVVSIACGQCGDEFIPKYRRTKFCSRTCSATANERAKGNNPKIIFNCAKCGKESIRYNPPTWKAPKYCSAGCQVADTANENNPKVKEYRRRWFKTEKGKASRRRDYERRKEKLQEQKENGKDSTTQD